MHVAVTGPGLPDAAYGGGIMDRLYVRLAYEDEDAAAAWLVRVLGFREVERKTNPDGSALIWLELSGGTVLVSRAAFGLQSPRQLGGVSHKMNVYVDDVDRHYDHTRSAGAVMERPLDTMPYGDRRYEVIDPEGHWWHIAQRL
jgi:uncharacterized glyoxalase superfamily protein PhnB